nr:unnamed protein product [Digitaria exilis]
MEVVTGALPSLLPKLADLLIGEYNLRKEVKGGIIFLQAELETMKAALEEISETPPDKLSKVDKIWARDVKELSYDIEDKIDAFMVRCKGQDSRLAEEQHGLRKIITRSHNLLIQPNIRRKIATDIRDIKSRVMEVHERRQRYDVNNNQGIDKPVKVDPRALVRYEDVSKLVGIDETRDEVIKILIQGNNQQVVSRQQDKIVSIVGFGGLGKTTLANAVYENLRKQFDCSAFVPVSRTPDMDKLFNNLLYQLAKRNNACTTDNAIYELREFLGSKRYFIVIDDIWDISHWEAIRRIYGHDGKDKCPNEELEEVSDKILTKCAGVPLAIITVASLLASKGRSKLDWYEVYNSIGTGELQNMLAESLNKLQNIQNLSIGIFGRSGSLKGWTGPPSLRSLKVTPYCFPKLPAWINPSHVQNLSLLVICVAEIQQEDLKTLGKFPALRYLLMQQLGKRSPDAPTRELVICGGSFPCLLRCKLLGHYERVVFQQGAMPSLTSLELHIYRRVWHAWEPTGIPNLGFENLPSLLELRVGLREGHGDPSKEEARTALRNMAEIHPNHPNILADDK